MFRFDGAKVRQLFHSYKKALFGGILTKKLDLLTFKGFCKGTLIYFNLTFQIDYTVN